MKQNKYSNSGPPEKNLNFSQMPKQTPKQQKEQELKKQLDEYYKKKFQQGRQDWQEANDANTLDQRNILQGMWNISQFVDPGISTNIMNIGINKLRGTPQEPGDYAGILGSLIPYGKNITQTTKPFIKKTLGNIDKGEDAYNLVTQQYGGEANWLDQYELGGPPVKKHKVLPLDKRFIFNQEVLKDKILQSQAMSCHKGQCLEGANTYVNKYVFPQMSMPNTWKISESYGIVSGDPNQPYGESMDSWDAAALMQSKGAIRNYAASLYGPNKKRRTEEDAARDWYNMPDEEKKKIYSGMTLGTLVNYGDYGGLDPSRREGSNEKAGLFPSRHSARVVGFTEEGEPVVYDWGEIKPLSKSGLGHPITNITTPKEYSNYNYDYVKKWQESNQGYEYDPNEKLILNKSNIRKDEEPVTKEEQWFVDGFNKNIEKIMAATGAPQDDVIKAGKVAFGIMQGETRGGRGSVKAKAKEFSKPLLNAITEIATLGFADTEESSKGLTRMKADMLAGDETNKYSQILKKMGYDPKDLDLWDPETAAIATTALLLSRKGEIEGVDKWYLRAKQHNLPAFGEKGKKFLQEGDSNYANNVIQNASRLYSPNTGQGLPETEKWIKETQDKIKKQRAMSVTKKALGGQTNWLDQYELGGYTEDPIKKLAQSNNAVKVNQVPKGYKQLGVSGNKTYYDKEAREAVPGTIGGGPDGNWEKSIIKMLQEGVSPEELVKKGHISQSSVPKFQQYYKPVYTETIQPQSTNTTGSNTNVTKVQDKKQLDFEFGVPWAGERKDVTHLVGSGIYSYKDESGKEYGVRAYDLPGQYDSKTQKWNTNEGYGNATRIYAYEKDNKLIPFDPNFSTTFSDDKAKKVYYTKTGLDPKYISQKEQSKALEKGPQTQMASGSDFLLNQGAKYNPNLDTTSNLNQGNLSTGTFTNINKTVGEENLPSFREKEFKHGGMKKLPGAKRFTSKNIQSSINTLFSRNYDLFGPSGKKYYSPLSKYAPGGEPDVPVIPDPEMVGYVLPEFTVTADAPDYAPAVKKFMETQGTEQGYVDALKRDYINRQAGLNQLAGLNMKQFPQDVEENFRRNYQYDKNTAIMDELARQRGFDITDRASYIDKLSPEEKAILANSRYEEYLQPSYNARSLAGLKELGKYMGLGNIADAISIPGLTRKEQEDIRNEKMLGIPTGGLQAFQVFDIPGQALANLVRTSGNLSTGSDFRTMPGNMPGDETSPWPAGRSASDVSDLDAAMMNPLNWTMATDIPELISKIPQGARALRKFFTKDPGDLEAAQYFNDYERARTALDDADFTEWKNRKSAEEAAQREDDLYRQYLNSQQNPFPSERELDNMYRAYNESEPNIDTRDIRSQYADDIARWAREYEQDNFINPFEPDPLDVEDYTMEDYYRDLDEEDAFGGIEITDDADDPFGGLPSSGQSNRLSSEAQDINSFTDEDMVGPTSSYPSSITDLVRNNSNIQSFADIQNYYNNNPAAFNRLMGMYGNPERTLTGNINLDLANQLFDAQRDYPDRYRNMLYDMNRDLSGTGFSNQLPPPPSQINIPSEVTNLRRIEQPYASSRQANREIRDFLNAQDIDTVFLQKELESADQFPSILREAGLPENVTVDDLGNLTDSQRAEFVRAIRNRVVDMINSNDPIIQRARQAAQNRRDQEAAQAAAQAAAANYNSLSRSGQKQVLKNKVEDLSKNIKFNDKNKVIKTIEKDKSSTGTVDYSYVEDPTIHKLNDKSVLLSTEELDPLIEDLENIYKNMQDGPEKNAILRELEDARSTKWLRTEFADELENYYGLKPDRDLSIVTNRAGGYGAQKNIVDGKGNVLGTINYDTNMGKVNSTGVNIKFHPFDFNKRGWADKGGIKGAQAILEESLYKKYTDLKQKAKNEPEHFAAWGSRHDHDILKKIENMSEKELENYAKKVANKRIKQIEWNNNNKIGEALYRAVYHGNKDLGLKTARNFVDTHLPNPIHFTKETAKRAERFWDAGTRRKNPKTGELWPVFENTPGGDYTKIIREFGGQRNWLDNY